MIYKQVAKINIDLIIKLYLSGWIIDRNTINKHNFVVMLYKNENTK